MNKYKNHKVKHKQFVFDSRKEFERYLALADREKRGEIQALTVHPEYMLVEGFVDSSGKRERAIKYTPDFEYFEVKTRRHIVEDVKSEPTKTTDYVIRRKLFKRKYPDCVFVEVIE